jgi:hypothetical protein
VISLVWKTVTRRTGMSILIAALCAVAVLVPAAGAGGQAPLVSYVTTGKLKVHPTMSYVFSCSVPCSVVETTTLKLGSARIPTVAGPATFPAGPIAAKYIIKSKKAVKFLRHNASKGRLISSVTAIDVATGNQQTINRTFKLKR